jgi:hypothetical protein
MLYLLILFKLHYVHSPVTPGLTPGGAGRVAMGSWQPGRSSARGGGRRSRATERKGRDGDLFKIFQKFKGFTVK